jgi:hypothetical protein
MEIQDGLHEQHFRLKDRELSELLFALAMYSYTVVVQFPEQLQKNPQHSKISLGAMIFFNSCGKFLFQKVSEISVTAGKYLPRKFFNFRQTADIVF